MSLGSPLRKPIETRVTEHVSLALTYAMLDELRKVARRKKLTLAELARRYVRAGLKAEE